MGHSKLTIKAHFAEMAGVSSAAITKACKNSLKPALVGSRINMNHPAAVRYIESKVHPEIKATGYDPYFEQAVELCRKENRYSIRFVTKSFPIGIPRARKIVDLMKAGGIIPEPGELPPKIIPQRKVATRGYNEPREQETRPEPPPPPPQRTVVSGHAAGKRTKKEEALQNVSTESYKHEIPDNMQIFADMTLRELIERFGTDAAFVDWLKAIKDLETIETKRIKNAESAGVLINRELVRVGIIEPINNAHIQLLTDGAKTLSLKIQTMVQAGDDLKEINESVIDQMSSFIRPVKDKITKALKKA